MKKKSKKKSSVRPLIAPVIVCAATVTILGFQEESGKVPDAERLATKEPVPPATLPAGAGTTSPSALTTAVAEAAPVPASAVAVDFSAFGTEPAISLGAEVNTPLNGGPVFQASILSRREANISLKQLSAIRAAGRGSVLLDLGLPTGPVQTVFTSVVENNDGGCSFVGKIVGAPLSEVILTQQEDAVVGDISLNPSQEFLLAAGPGGGPRELRQVDRSLMPACGGTFLPPADADGAGSSAPGGSSPDTPPPPVPKRQEQAVRAAWVFSPRSTPLSM